MKPPDFPCERIPDDEPSVRLLGLYPQPREGFWMQRLKTPGGRLTGQQWRALGAIARVYTPSAPLHLTTRQDIELHDVPGEKVPELQQRLADAGLTTVGACGDTLRNVTVCPCSGALDASADLMPAAGVIRSRLERMDGIYELPRKFKIALSCGGDCGQPYINDLGLIATERDGQFGFCAIVAGSLGAKPAPGITFRAFLTPDEAVDLAEAAVRMFARTGDRTNRRRARLRHVRERVGDGPFLAELTETFERVRMERSPTEVPVRRAETGLTEQVRLHFPGGDISPDAADGLGRLTETGRAVAHLACHHSVMVFAPSRAELDEMLAGSAALPSPADDEATVVACPGSTWCRRALVDTRNVAKSIRAAVAGIPAGARTVCISGCPNGCAHTAVADVGLSGRQVRTNGSRTEAFDLYAGGAMGRTPRLAQRIAEALPANDVPQAVAKLLDPRREA
ncbi:MAG: hypothetical protein ACOC9S_06330 [Planctomycetota bacterium]